MVKKTKRRNYPSKGKTKRGKSRVKRQVKRVKNRTRKNRNLRGGASRSPRRADAPTRSRPAGDPPGARRTSSPSTQKRSSRSPRRADAPTRPRPAGDPPGARRTSSPAAREPAPEPAPVDPHLSSLEGGEVGVISGHGAEIKGEFTVVPPEFTFCFYSSSGETTDVQHRRLTNVSSRPKMLVEEIGRLQGVIKEQRDRLQEYKDMGGGGGLIRKLQRELEQNEAYLRNLESNDYFFREYQSGALIPNYSVDFNKVAGYHLSANGKRRVGIWLDGGIFTEDVDELGGGSLLSIGTDVWWHTSLDASLAKHREADYMPLDLEGNLRFKLSDLFKIITEKEDEDRPRTWVGAFCRSGTPFGIEELIESCTDLLFPLEEDFFSEKIRRRGQTKGAHTRKKSLALDVRTQNFKGMLDGFLEVKKKNSPEDPAWQLVSSPRHRATEFDSAEFESFDNNTKLMSIIFTMKMFLPLNIKEVCWVLLHLSFQPES
jgi:hypothetical protein